MQQANEYGSARQRGQMDLGTLTQFCPGTGFSPRKAFTRVGSHIIHTFVPFFTLHFATKAVSSSETKKMKTYRTLEHAVMQKIFAFLNREVTERHGNRSRIMNFNIIFPFFIQRQQLSWRSRCEKDNNGSIRHSRPKSHNDCVLLAQTS